MRKTLRLMLIIVLSMLFGYYVGTNKIALAWKNYSPELAISGKEPPPSVKNVDFTQFWTVLEKLENSYYDKTAFDSQKILDGAISGMVSSLDDPYTVYLPPAQNSDFKEGMAGQFQGIGAELGMKDKQIVVVAPIDGSPAQKAGLKAGDAIVKVEDQLTMGWTLNQAVDKIRGPKGSGVTLTIVPKDAEEVKEVKIVRDTITVKSVTTWVKPIKDVEGIKITEPLKSRVNDKVAYIRISQFGDNTNQEWLGLSNSLNFSMQRDKSIRGIILDLRNNPGGYLTDAVFISSEFIDKGTIVMQDDGKSEPTKLNVSRDGLLLDVPLIVLMNKGSASASEIVAGALRDHNRARIVGELSFGKGTIQQAEDLGKGSGIHVTVAKWLTPNGTWVHKKGLEPDVKVELDSKDPSHDTQLEKAIEELLQ